MATYKKAYHQKLLESFALGMSVRDAAEAADCSAPTARKFREQHWDEVVALQKQTTAGVLDSLKELLPQAVAKLRKLLNPPPLASVPAAIPPDADPVTAAALAAAMPKPSTVSDEIRIVRAVFDCFEVMRDLDTETRLREVEKQLAELRAAGLDPNGKPGSAPKE